MADRFLFARRHFVEVQSPHVINWVNTLRDSMSRRRAIFSSARVASEWCAVQMGSDEALDTVIEMLDDAIEGRTKLVVTPAGRNATANG